MANGRAIAVNREAFEVRRAVKISPTQEVRISVAVIDGREIVDVRVYWAKMGAMLRSNNALAVEAAKLPELIAALQSLTKP